MARKKQEKHGNGQVDTPAQMSDEHPEKPGHWSPKITGFRNTYNEDRTDWEPFERQRRPKLDPENVDIAERLAARMA
ncbi:MAG TPA: hypothetical protein VG078_04710, partial [Acidimicrobiales bacterium]|nr:hypothetical protein [Acidimicrobiales bacterium]